MERIETKQGPVGKLDDSELLVNEWGRERIVFHYNKAHNQDASIPQWVIKFKGQSFYVNHVKSTIGFETKETPDNDQTKGSIQFKGRLIIKKRTDGQVIAEIY